MSATWRARLPGVAVLVVAVLLLFPVSYTHLTLPTILLV